MLSDISLALLLACVLPNALAAPQANGSPSPISPADGAPTTVPSLLPVLTLTDLQCTSPSEAAKANQTRIKASTCLRTYQNQMAGGNGIMTVEKYVCEKTVYGYSIIHP